MSIVFVGVTRVHELKEYISSAFSKYKRWVKTWHELKRVNPDSQQIVIAANPALPACTGNVSVAMLDITQSRPNFRVLTYGEQGLCLRADTLLLFSSYLCVQGVSGALRISHLVGTEERTSRE